MTVAKRPTKRPAARGKDRSPNPGNIRRQAETEARFVEGLRAYWREFGHAPTMPELAARIGCCDQWVYTRFWRLVKRGVCRPLPRPHRFMALVEQEDQE